MKKENLSKFYSVYRSQIFSAIVAISSLFLLVFVIYPQTVKLISNQQAMGDLNKKSQLLETKVTALENYNGEDVSRKLGIALATLPADKDFGNILGLLQHLTSQLGFSISSITFSGSGGSKVGNLGSVGVKMDIKGAKAMVQTLLNNLESSPRLIRVSNIDIAPSRQNSQATEVSLVVEALYSQLPQNVGGVDSPLPVFSQKDEELISKLESSSAEVSSSSSAVPSTRGKSNPFE